MRAGSTKAGWLGAVDPRITDSLLAVALTAVGCLAGSQYHPAGWRPFDAFAYVLTCLISLPLAVRRRFPVAVLLESNAAFAGYLYAGYQPSVNFWGPAIALIAVAAYRPRGITLACAAVTGAVVFYSGMTAVPVAVAAAQALLIPVVALAFGSGLRRMAERNTMLAALTAQLHAEQQDRARRAVVDERVRIARELHDVIAHHMSVISVQAGLARYVLGSDPATSRSALETISDTSREALAEMRRMLALLRIDPDGADAADGHTAGGPDQVVDPAPGLDRLGTLVERVRAAGVPVDVVVAGEPWPLAPGADLCVYRVIQEGLTNVLTHAAPARATVTLEYRRDGITARVTDDGRPPPPDQGAPAAGAGRVGHGLSGMRERSRLYGGTLTAGHRAEGGFEVVLTLPAAALQAAATDRTEAR